MSDWFWSIYLGVGVIWFAWCFAFWWEDYRDDRAAGRRWWARATLLAPVWPLVVLRLVGVRMGELARRTPNVGRVIGDLALDAKGRSVDE